MTSDRPYRKGLSYQTAFEELHEQSGSQFDPKLSNLHKSNEEDQQKNENIFKLNLFNNDFQRKPLNNKILFSFYKSLF